MLKSRMPIGMYLLLKMQLRRWYDFTNAPKTIQEHLSKNQVINSMIL